MSEKELESLKEKISEQTGELKVLSSVVGTMVTEFRDFKNGIGPRLEKHGNDITALETNRKNDIQYLGAVDGKVDDHIKTHWQWITVMIAILGAVTALAKAFISFEGRERPATDAERR